MPSDIVRTSTRKIEVEILSRANPEPGLLRLARVAVQGSPEISETMESVDGKRSVNRDLFTTRLQEKFPLESVVEVATYLADEFEQIGEGILLISPRTGKALAVLTDDDFYLPAPVPRENGHMVQPARRVKPEIEALLVQHTFDIGRDQILHEKVLGRLDQTELLREEGDPRMDWVTREGRKRVANRIQEALPSILTSAPGITGTFLTFLAPGAPPGGYWTSSLKIQDRVVVRRGTQDTLTSNFRHDPFRSTLNSVVWGWVQLIARSMLTEAQLRVGPIQPLRNAIQGRDQYFWVAEPNAALGLRRAGCQVLPSEGGVLGLAFCIHGPIGFLKVDEKACQSSAREYHDNWVLEAELSADLWVDWNLIEVFRIESEVSGASVETSKSLI